MRVTIGLGVALVFSVCCACNPSFKDGALSGEGEGEGEGNTCELTILATDPQQGDGGVYYRSVLSVQFSGVVDDVTLTLLRDEEDIDGSQEVDPTGTLVTFVPADPLLPDTAYELHARYCEYQDLWVDFNTSSLGEEVDLGVTQDLTWWIDPNSFDLVEPEGGAAIMSLIEGGFLLEVQDTGTETLALLGALGTKVEQERCAPTTSFGDADLSENPHLQWGPQDITSGLGVVEEGPLVVDLYDLQIEGELDVELGLDELSVEALVDVRGLETFGCDSGDNDCACEIMSALGVTCEMCPDGDPYCLTLLATGGTGEITSLDLVVRSSEDVEGDTGCSE